MHSPSVQFHRDPVPTDRAGHPGWLFRMLSPGRRELLFWVLQFSFWAIIGVIGMLMTLAFQSSVPGVGWVIFIRVSTGFVFTAGLRWIYRRPRFRHRHGFAKWPLVFGFCLALGLLELIVLHAMIVAGISFPGGENAVSPKLLVVRLFILNIWSVLYFAFHLLEQEHHLVLRATNAELTARENELRVLQARMGPHFLFNALNGVLACKDDPEAVGDVTRSLSDYLKFLLAETRPLEPLSREIDALEKYLTAQTSHMSGKLVCRIQCERAARTVMVPPMMVHPLLEDAFHHRSQSNGLPLQIWLTARTEEGFLRVTVSDTRGSLTSDDDPLPDTGIRAISQRLNLLLGPEARVERHADNGWVRVTIHIPLAGSVRDAA